MKYLLLLPIFFITVKAYACDTCTNYDNDNFKITGVKVVHNANIASTIWEISVAGKAGETTPKPIGQFNGAPVLAYVFPTSLKPTDVGFSATEGIVAMALTSHPDFDDTPLWDENNDTQYDNDGIVWHPHWVVLTEDKRVGGGLSVKQYKKGDTSVVLPPTNPGMPMYFDSPGFQVITKGNTIKIVIPDYRINHQTSFSYDAVTALLQVNTEDMSKPMLGVMKVYGVASSDLTLPYAVSAQL